MQKLEVFGANKLKGQIKISGSKNASLPILAATLLSNKKIVIKNLPKVRDIKTMLTLLKSLGSKVKVKNNQALINNIKQKSSEMKIFCVMFKKLTFLEYQPFLISALGGTRTPNLLIRSQMLYPIEPRALNLICKD